MNKVRHSQVDHPVSVRGIWADPAFCGDDSSLEPVVLLVDDDIANHEDAPLRLPHSMRSSTMQRKNGLEVVVVCSIRTFDTLNQCLDPILFPAQSILLLHWLSSSTGPFMSM